MCVCVFGFFHSRWIFLGSFLFCVAIIYYMFNCWVEFHHVNTLSFSIFPMICIWVVFHFFDIIKRLLHIFLYTSFWGVCFNSSGINKCKIVGSEGRRSVKNLRPRGCEHFSFLIITFVNSTFLEHSCESLTLAILQACSNILWVSMEYL